MLLYKKLLLMTFGTTLVQVQNSTPVFLKGTMIGKTKSLWENEDQKQWSHC